MTLNDKVQVGDTTAGTSTSTTTTASQWQTYNHYTAERGWECPRCGRINAPWVRQCDCPNNNNWTITTDWTYKPEWWKEVTCQRTKTVPDSDTFKVHPETTTWKTPSSVCSSDSTTSVKSNPNSTIYTTATNPTVGGSDYWNPITKEWKNVDVNILNTQNNKTNLKTAWSCTIPNEFTTFRTDLPETYTTTNNDLEPLTRHFKD